MDDDAKKTPASCDECGADVSPENVDDVPGVVLCPDCRSFHFGDVGADLEDL